MGEFKPTKDQAKALKATGTVLVSAAAGSGKTAVLSNRVLQMLTNKDNVFSKKFDINDLLIVTFTNAAAQEMRERIAILIDEALQDNPTDRHLIHQKLSVDNAPIGTIDSFCINLVRDNFAEAGVEPNFKIASSEQLKVMSEDAVTTAYEQLAKNDFTAFSRLLTALGCETIDSNAKRAVTSVYDYICSLPMPDRWLDKVCDMYDNCNDLDESPWIKSMSEYIIDATEYFITALSELRSEMVEDDPVTLNYQPVVDYYLFDLLPKLSDGAKACKYNDIHNAVNSINPPSAGRKRNGDIELREKIKALQKNLTDFNKKLGNIFGYDKAQEFNNVKSASEFVKALVSLVRDYRRLLDELKAERGLMSFSDVEFATLGLLCDDVDGALKVKPSAQKLCDRYELVMVDEYQDTNDLQNAIFNALSGGGERLFLVGDVKQSIYRFRQANPGNFIKMRDSFPEYDEATYPSKISLSGNFRSRPDICNFVNFCFDRLMTRQSAEIDYLKTDWLDSMSTNLPDNPDSGVEVHLLECDDAAMQAQHIAGYIKQCVDSGLKVNDKQGLRNAKYSDFLVLVRNFKKYADIFVSAMKDRGIPVVAELNTDFFARVEIMMAMSLLQAIDNPLKDIPLLATMMSPIFGFSADEVAQMRIGRRHQSVYASLLEFAKTNERASKFLQSLSKYRAWASTLPTDRLICKIYDDTGLTAVARKMEDGASRRANMLLLAEYAASYESSGYKGLSAFIRYAKRVQDSTDNLSGACASDSEDAVRLMTIHKSKGLQAPICIVAGLENKFNSADSKAAIVKHEQYGIGIKLCDMQYAARYDTFARNAIAHAERSAQVAEEMRLLYVAMTRAEEKLVLVSAQKDIDKELQNASARMIGGLRNGKINAYSVQRVNCLSDWLNMCLADGENGSLEQSFKLDGVADPVKILVKKITIDDQIESDGKAECEQIDIDLSAQLDYRYPYEPILGIESKYSVSALSKSMYDASMSCVSKPAFITGDNMTPAERGTATHRFMCYADYSLAEKDINAEAQRLVSLGKLTKEQADGIDIEAISTFFDSEIYEQILSAERVVRESRFILEIPVSEIDADCNYDETVLLQGVADCVIFDSDSITVVDFKTDRNTTEQALIEKYTTQLKLYARAFSANYNLPVKRCLLYSFGLRKAVETPLS